MATLLHEEGKREKRARERNAAIESAAWALAGDRKWPSPGAVAKRVGISESVVERETRRLDRARRRWVKLTGRGHPQWRDPDATPVTEEDNGVDARSHGPARAVENAPADDTTAAAAIKEATRPGKPQPEANPRKLRRRIAVLEETIRRMELGVRPDEVAMILEAGSKKGTAGEAHKGVGRI